MNDGYVLLAEKEEIWAKMLMNVLEDNNIPCVSLPVYGAGLTIRIGMQDILKVYVPSENLPHAMELFQELFSSDVVQDEA